MHEGDAKILFSYYNHMLVLLRPHIHSFVIDFPGKHNIGIELLSMDISKCHLRQTDTFVAYKEI